MVWKLRKMGSETIRIPGNSGGFYDEPGIVWVSVDDNRDGIPNDTWYEIPGSDDDNPTLKARIIRSFGLHYILMPGFTNSFGQTFGQPPFDLKCWVDNKGRIGDMQLGWPSGWGVSGADHAWLELSGTRLRGDPGAVEGGPDAPFGNGYVDSGYLLEFSVSNAMKADGTPANLPYIDFVRVQTGAFYYGTGVAGDLSTEIGGAEGL
jgi:hypothetical protein